MLLTTPGTVAVRFQNKAASPAGFAPSKLISPWIPGLHFAAALGFYAVGALGLVLAAPDLAGGMFFLPRVIALVHLFTLGWIVLSIFGALCQFLPVAIGASIRFPRLVYASFAAQTIGVASFVLALIFSSRSLLLAGGFTITFAFTAFGVNLAATLIPVRDRNLTYWALAGAVVFLLATPIYGMVLAFDLHDGGLTNRFATIGQHAHIAILGFVLMVVVGVAHRLLPMFLLSHGAGERAAWVAIALLFSSAAVLTVPWGGGVRNAVAASLGGAGIIAFIVQAATFFKHRQRKAIDPGMRLAASGVIGLGLALLLAPFVMYRGLTNLHLLTTYFVVLLGSITLFVAGHYYKILPFLVWNHRYGPLLGKQKVPQVSQLYSANLAFFDGVLLVLGLLGLAIATLIGSVAVARVASVVFAIGAWMQIIVVARVALRKVA